ncbi:helix-turn-helix domain-containing protein [Burkholderia alba]|uniref:helix-turn-helix domain-containing protein n=1 Tax=Burkholderia alba TaxID=2683677 RepID=UPI002B052A0D|nr:helix-turn-helix domain-containing protein [Burkholderia alba]
MISSERPSDSQLCPDPLTRAPCARLEGKTAHARLGRVPLALQGAVVVVVHRDTRGAGLTDAQRLTHFPASPLVSLSWVGSSAGLVEPTGGAPRWRPFGATVMLSGSQSRPLTSWAPADGRGGMICFTADVARTLFGLEPAALHDRFVAAADVLGADWHPFLDALRDAADDAATQAALEQHLAPRWRTLQGSASPLPSLRRLGRHWVERLAWQAREWRRTSSPRQVERRIKAHSGRSLREWQALVKTEGVFFTARERYEAGEPFDWVGLAQDEGFADQAHLSRTIRRITGFSPSEFIRRFGEDESFWLYRLWV